MVYFAVEVKFNFTLVLQLYFLLLLILKQVRVYPEVLLKLSLVYFVIVQLHRVFVDILPHSHVLFYHFFLLLLDEQAYKQASKAFAHREYN